MQNDSRKKYESRVLDLLHLSRQTGPLAFSAFLELVRTLNHIAKEGFFVREVKSLQDPSLCGIVFMPISSSAMEKVSHECEPGYCGNCKHCDGVDEEKDVCKCRRGNPHKDWRFNDNEACPDWEPDELTRRYLEWDSQKSK